MRQNYPCSSKTPKANRSDYSDFIRQMRGQKKSYDDAHLQEQILQKELEIVRDNLAKSEIKAPISGIVLEKICKYRRACPTK